MTQLGLVTEGPVQSADSKEFFESRGCSEISLEANQEAKEWYSVLSASVFFRRGVGANMGQDRQKGCDAQSIQQERC